MIVFEPILEERIELALEIVNSNSAYNTLENGTSIRSIKEVRSEFLNPQTESYFIIIENKYVGLIDFLKRNPKDESPWIGLLMIHHEYQFFGYGKKAYVSFEKKLKQEKYKKVRLGVLQENKFSIRFWESLGFTFYGTSIWEEKIVNCYEKNLN